MTFEAFPSDVLADLADEADLEIVQNPDLEIQEFRLKISSDTVLDLLELRRKMGGDSDPKMPLSFVLRMFFLEIFLAAPGGDDEDPYEEDVLH